MHELLDDPAPTTTAAPKGPAAAPKGPAHPFTQAELHELLDDPAPTTTAAPKGPAAVKGPAHPFTQAELHELLDDPAPATTAAPKGPAAVKGPAHPFTQAELHELLDDPAPATTAAPKGPAAVKGPAHPFTQAELHELLDDPAPAPAHKGPAHPLTQAEMHEMLDDPAPAATTAAPRPPAAPAVTAAPTPAVTAAPRPVAAPAVATPAVTAAPRPVAAPAAAAPRAASATANSFTGTDDIKGPGKDRWTSYGKGDKKTYGWDLGGTHGVKNSGGDAGTAIYAVSNVEGRYDSVQTYDAGILSFGIMQWTLHAGSLQKFLGFLKDKSGPEGRAAFQDDFAAKGIDVKPAGGQYQLWYNGKEYPLGADGEGKAAIDKLVRDDKATARTWAQMFAAAGADSRVQKAEFERAKEMYQEAQGIKFTGKVVDQSLKACKNTFHAKYREQYGKAEAWTTASPKAGALFFSMRVNNPKYANAAFLKAIDAFYDAHGTDRAKWPAAWGEDFGNLVEAKCKETLSNWHSEGGNEGRVEKTLRFWNKAQGPAGAVAAGPAQAPAPATAKATGKTEGKTEAPADPGRQKKLRAQYAALLKQVSRGQIDQGEAISRMIAYDRKLNGGSSSVDGLVLLPVMLADLVRITLARTSASSTPAPVRPAVTNPAAPAVTPGSTKPVPAAPIPAQVPVQVPAQGPAQDKDTTQPAAGGHIPGVTDARPHVGDKAMHAIVNPGKKLPSVYACVPPGGVKGSVEVFLFLHGMYAHEAPRKGMAIQDPHPEEAMNLAGAMAKTQRNLVTLAPIAKMIDDYPMWKDLAADGDGYSRLIQGAIANLPEGAHDGPITVGSISIAGHSAGGQALGEAAEQLKDDIHDMTMEDGGYGDNTKKHPGAHAWKDAHAQVVKWLLTGKTEKLLRVLLHGENNHGEGHVLDSNLNVESLTDAANTMGLTGVKVTKEVFAKHEKRSVKTMYLDHKLHITGLPAPRTVSVFNMPGSEHMDVRNLATQVLIEEDRDTEFALPGAAPSVGTEAAPPKHHDGHAKAVKPTAPKPEPVNQPAPTSNTTKPVQDPPHVAPPGVAPPVVAPPVVAPDHADKAVKHPKGGKHKADAGPKPGDIVVADLTDLDALIADVHDPHVKAVAQAVHAVSDKSKELTSTALDNHELKGPGRVELIGMIRTTHGQIAGLGGDVDPTKLAAIKSRMFRALQEVSPYHEQFRNIDILENNAEMGARGKTGDTTRTCNITSLAMALEGLGRSAGDYTGNKAYVLAAAKHFKVGDKNIAAHGDLQAAGGGGSDWQAMLALRLPDFLELAAIAHFMSGADDASVLAGADKAWGGIKDIDKLRLLATEFGAGAEVKYFSFDPTAAATGKRQTGTKEDHDTKESEALDGQTKDQRHKADDLIDLHNKIDLETDPGKKAALQKQYDKKKADMGSAMTDKKTGVDLEKYKQAVIATIGAELAAGKAVETHVIQHFVRVRAVHDEFVVIDDPARQARAHKNVRWEEARAEGLFAKRLVLT